MNSFKALPSHLKLIFFLLLFVTIASIFTSFILWRGEEKAETTELSAEAQIEEVVLEVSKVIVLPQNESPTLATVTDLSLLKDQPFFAKAVIGDLVLIYPTSKKAILWRPSTKQVVEVSSLNITSPNSGNTTESSQ